MTSGRGRCLMRWRHPSQENQRMAQVGIPRWCSAWPRSLVDKTLAWRAPKGSADGSSKEPPPLRSNVSCGRARRTRPVQARATATLLARLAARHCAGSVHAHSTEERHASAAPIRPKASNKQLLAIVNGTRRPHTMNMMSAAKSKRASPVGVAGWTTEHGSMLHLQRFAPLRP